jgi:hypothetical protein
METIPASSLHSPNIHFEQIANKYHYIHDTIRSAPSELWILEQPQEILGCDSFVVPLRRLLRLTEYVMVLVETMVSDQE